MVVVVVVVVCGDDDDDDDDLERSQSRQKAWLVQAFVATQELLTQKRRTHISLFGVVSDH